MMRTLTRYLPAYSISVLYMLQTTEYSLRDFWRWYGQVTDWRKVAERKQLVLTPVASALLATFIAIQFALYLYLVVVWFVIDRATTSSDVIFGLYAILWIYVTPIIAAAIFSLFLAGA